MQVHGTHTGLTPSGNWTSTNSADAKSVDGVVPSPDKQRTDGAGGGLIAILRTRWGDVPEVRADRIDEARKTLASGEYFTRAAAEATAKAILGGEV
jgi:hypothetical protein